MEQDIFNKWRGRGNLPDEIDVDEYIKTTRDSDMKGDVDKNMNPMNKILVIGTGSIGERHVRCMLNTKRTVVGICELNKKLRERVAQEYKIEKAYDSLDKALEYKWDGAVVATPAHTHITVATKCAQAGFALLIEKPLAVEADEVASLISLVEQKQLLACVAYVYRAHPALKQMREAIISGEYGKPLELVAVGGQNFPTYRPAYASTYYAKHETGGGAIQDGITHVLNAAEWLVGPITRISCDAAHLALADVEVEDTVHIHARHGKVLASYAYNQHQAPNENSITVVCEHGTLRFNLHKHNWQVMEKPDTKWQTYQINFHQRDDWFQAQEDAFLDVLERKAKPLCSIEEGLQTLKVNCAALESVNKNGEPVIIDS